MARGTSLSVEVRGLDALRHRLKAGNLLRPARKDLVGGAGRAAHLTARRAAKPHPADKGTLGRNITLEIDKDRARVAPARSIAGIAFVIEEGRRPGRRPPYRAIKRWAQAHGIPTPIRAIQEQIKVAGTRGVHFMRAAQEVAERVLRGDIPKTEREIKALWERPR